MKINMEICAEAKRLYNGSRDGPYGSVHISNKLLAEIVVQLREMNHHLAYINPTRTDAPPRRRAEERIPVKHMRMQRPRNQGGNSTFTVVT